MKDEEVQQCWKRYFYSLLIEISDSNGEDENTEPDSFLYCRKIKTKDVKDVLGKMKNKIVGPDSISIDECKCIGNIGLIWFSKNV